MGLSASQGRMLLLTARKSDLEFRAQQISQRRLILSQQLEDIALEYEAATSNRKMKISLYELNAQDTTGVVTKTDNLTYKNLVSGCMALGSDLAGIKASTAVGTSGLQYASTSAYRLVDPQGRIVVSHDSEIPETVTKETKSTVYENAVDYKNGIKVATNKVIDTKNGETQNESTTTNYYFKMPQTETINKDNKDVETITKYFKDKNISDYNITFNENGIIRVSAKDNDAEAVYFDSVDGAKVESPSSFTEVEGGTLNLLKHDASIPQSTTVTNATSIEGNVNPLGHGEYALVDSKGNEVQRYIVDSTLKTGSLLEGEGSSGPNYLQDCLRNGKYAIQKYNTNAEEESRKWTNISWDSAANIGDEYYTDDDEKAKTRYDRLQNQIQNQDKKLELELDNIETQRSAVTTEEESVKKVIDENIEGSFNAFA